MAIFFLLIALLLICSNSHWAEYQFIPCDFCPMHMATLIPLDIGTLNTQNAINMH